MLFITGGAYSGKRQYLRSRETRLFWHSAYEGKRLEDWQSSWMQARAASAAIVLEGWELWIADDLGNGQSPTAIREAYNAVLLQLKQAETEARMHAHAGASTAHLAALLMLEMGRGIVPLLPDERSLRDTAGWLLQDAAAMSEEAVYIWHGLSRVMKRALVDS